jgi:predicted metal-binding protein
MITIDDIVKKAKQFDDDIELLPVEPDEIIFEQNIKINCFYCGRYNNNWKCPPRIPDIDYRAMLYEFKNMTFVYKSFLVNEENRDTVRIDSTNHIHKFLLELEKFLYENNITNSLSFIGGSCKLCKTGCGKEKCNNPYLARMPVEAAGINVVKTLAQKGVSIVFPVVNEMKRVGLILWN